jgi:hypothetical protein
MFRFRKELVVAAVVDVIAGECREPVIFIFFVPLMSPAAACKTCRDGARNQKVQTAHESPLESSRPP